MKIIFETEKERACLEHILTDWISYCIEDPLGCEPACRDETSPGCIACIKNKIGRQLDENMLDLTFFADEDFLTDTDIRSNRDSYYRVIDRLTRFVDIRELHDKLRKIPNAYPGFVVGIIRYASTDEKRRDKVIEYLNANPDVTPSDVVKFVMEQDDFHVAAASTRDNSNKSDNG